jgi:hypothetical protein
MKRASAAVLGLLFWIVGCSTSPSIKGGLEGVPEIRRDLFPKGTYTHQVTVQVPSQRTYSFKGLVTLSEDSIRVVGLGFLNATAFRLWENRKTQELQCEIYYEPMKKYEPRLRQFYGHLHTLLTLKAHEEELGTKRIKADADGFPLEIESMVAEKQVKIEFQNYDEKKIPRRIKIVRPEFSVEVEVTDYEI